MSAGLFALSCPNCGAELAIDHLGTGSCCGCGHVYLSRFGYLIPIDAAATLAPAGPSEA
jgi:hypothetical protein